MKTFQITSTLKIAVCLLVLFGNSTYAQKTDKFMGEIVNYDEEAVPKYILPDPLVTTTGLPVKNKAMWEKSRRAEIIELFKNNVYGQTPSRFDSIRFEVTKTTDTAMNGLASSKEIIVHIWNKGNTIGIPVVMFVPNKRNKPSPLFLLINNRSKRNTDPLRAVKSTFWPAELLIEKGYAIAAFHVGDAAPDRKDSYQHGVLDKLYPELLNQKNGMKAIGAWAWAASRVMDYLETDKDIDAKKVALVGHSRGGKTSLWAGALDQRFALIFSSCSGSTGASLARRQYGETISLVTKQFGYWFADTYKDYSTKVNELPVDQHMLISLIAPRPVYTTNATEDRWADPRGSYLALINALPVYNLYKSNTALPPQPPAVNSPIIKSTIGYHFRTGKHDLNVYDWERFIEFANYHYQK
ncbi:glucuronyl esterase domain-containing protein [Mucilaginibacter aquatilis]|uniref:Acetylxylan esterase n=1 Tax=Mucilaginibacter aquatilis TaxID=1517760 RepID=A0A6I4I9T1_9SPHI|nr:acetylxylan esterase [Mucilaginibacter aquatilis]MVN91737.1 acetylxylan esterase [Mucilaginibacter aquatilis]